MNPEKKWEEEPSARQAKLRITLQADNVRDVEYFSSMIIREAREKNIKTKGPVRMPTEIMRITTRKTPCGEGSKTWDRFQMRIHKRVVDMIAESEQVTEIVQKYYSGKVHVDVTMT